MGIPRRARTAFIGAGLGVVALLVTWYAAHEVARLRRADVNMLLGFTRLNHPRLDWIPMSFLWFCDPSHYVVIAAIPIVIALVRGRRRLAVAAGALILGANATTEVLKPLAAGSRDPVPGVALTHATWPSGHSTASMAVALAVIICVSGRWRPVASAVAALFVVAVVYSLLALGWHYPSDVLGGFEVAGTWTLLALGGLWTYEAHHPALVARRRPDAGSRSVLRSLVPTIALGVGALGLGLAVFVLRPHALLEFAAGHPAFLTGAGALAVLSFGCAAGLNLLMRRSAAPLSGSGQAPTEALPGRPGRSLLG